MPHGTRTSIVRRRAPKWLLLLAAALAVVLAAGARGPAVAAAGADVERPQARQRPRAEPLPSEPQARNPIRTPGHRAPEAEDESEERQDPSGCPDRGQPLELIV